MNAKAVVGGEFLPAMPAEAGGGDNALGPVVQRGGWDGLPPGAINEALLERSRRAEMSLGAVYEISKLLASPHRLEPTLSGVLALLSSYFDMRHGLIALLDDEGDAELVVGSGWREGHAKRYFDQLPERAIGQIVVTGMPLVVPDIRRDPLFSDHDVSEWDEAPSDGGQVSFIGVPIKEAEQVLGTLTIDRSRTDDRPARYDADVRFLTMVANLVGQTLRLHKTLARDRDRLLADQARLAKRLQPGAAAAPAATIDGVIGNSPAVRAVMEKVQLVAKSRSTILLRGETGTGKEMFAHAIHDLSPRKDQPMISLNCAALSETVLESELFGHEKGAFTGAVATRRGRFELAHGGTLFLDEIGEISPSFQAKLLRVLQDGEFERVGGTKTLKVDVRLICATNRDLEAEVASGSFRADLYYRISVVPIFLPALRERKGDVSLLAAEFLERFNRENNTRLTLSGGALSLLEDCLFPGNVRELENCVRRTATLARGDCIVEHDFACRNDRCMSAVLWKGGRAEMRRPGFVPLPVAPAQAREAAAAAEPAEAAPSDEAAGSVALPPDSGADGLSERERLMRALETAGWVQAKAARILGWTPRQVGYGLRKHGIELKKF